LGGEVKEEFASRRDLVSSGKRGLEKRVPPPVHERGEPVFLRSKNCGKKRAIREAIAIDLFL